MTKRPWIKGLAALVVGGVFLFNPGSASAAQIELSLKDSIALALKNNPSMKIAVESKASSMWGLKQAQAGSGPELSFAHSSARSKGYSSLTGVPVYSSNFGNDFTLSLPIYSGGELEGKIDKAELGVKTAELGVIQAKQQLKLNVTTQYYNVLQTKSLEKVAQNLVDNLSEHFKSVKLKYEAGTVAKSDVLRAEVELANAEQSLIQAKNNSCLASANLNNAVGLPLDSEVLLKEDLEYHPYIAQMDDSIKYALLNRPEVLMADVAVDTAWTDVRIAKSGYLPSIKFVGTTGWQDGEFPGLGNNNWSLKLTASMNLFDSGLTKAGVMQAEHGVNKVVNEAKQAKDSVQLEVRQAYLGMQAAEKSIETSKVAVEKAEEDGAIAQVRYRVGLGTNLDVIDAQLALNQAKTNKIQAIYDYNINKAKLDKAMGIPVI
ncbi:MAG: tolC 1 [Firmicutes bacterium]|nr:tolC 1 [Bacillota bacterium]